MTTGGRGSTNQATPHRGPSAVKSLLSLSLALLALVPSLPARGQKARGTVKLYVTSSTGDDIHVIDLGLRLADVQKYQLQH